MRFALTFVVLVALQLVAAENADIVVVRDVGYKSGDALSDYEKTRCKLDLYAPAGKKDLPCIVWFHGGALSAGDNRGSTADAARALAAEGHLVAAVNYRLSPTVTYPAYLEDAAAAVAWMHQHAAEHGGS